MELKAIIKNQGYNLTELAQMLGVSQQNVSQLVSNKNIGLSKLRNIAKAINIPLSELIQKIEEETTIKTNNSNNNFVCPNCGAKLEIKKVE